MLNFFLGGELYTYLLQPQLIEDCGLVDTGLRNKRYHQIKWRVRAFAVASGHVFGVAFMTGFENAFYAKVTGR